MSTAYENHSDHDAVPPEARAWYHTYQRMHDGEEPGHNVFVEGIVAASEGRVSRTQARKAWHTLSGIPQRPRSPKGASPMPTTLQPTGPVLVGPTPLEVRLGKMEERVVCLEHALQDADALLARQHRTIEGFQQVLAYVDEFCELLRRYSSVGRAIMRMVRTNSSGDYALLFWLGDRLGLPLDSNDRGQRQQHFEQGLLLPGGRR